MKKISLITITLLLVLSQLLVACSPAATPTEAPVEEEAEAPQAEEQEAGLYSHISGYTIWWQSHPLQLHHILI